MLGTTQYITLEAATQMMEAAQAKALENGWKVAITIVDVAGNLIMFQKMDGTQMGSIAVSIGKARTAATFNRPTKAMEEMIAGGRTAFVAIDGIVPVQGGRARRGRRCGDRGRRRERRDLRTGRAGGDGGDRRARVVSSGLSRQAVAALYERRMKGGRRPPLQCASRAASDFSHGLLRVRVRASRRSPCLRA